MISFESNEKYTTKIKHVLLKRAASLIQWEVIFKLLLARSDP